MKEQSIVCVDDDEIILNSLGEQLKRAFGSKYIIELASSGAEALKIFAELIAENIEIPLIISDQNMVAMPGDILLITLQNLYPKTLKILFTGETNTEIIRNLINASALYRYIAKPWDETDLILTVTEALRCYAQNQQLIVKNELLLNANHKLEESLSLLIATLEATADGILVVDNRGKVIRYNQKFLDLWGIIEAKSKLQNHNRILDLALEQLSTTYACDLERKANFLKSHNYSISELNNGKILECYFQTERVSDFGINTVWSFRDVTERQKAKQTIEYQAFHDPLTGLANRSFFNRKLTAALEKNQQSRSKLAVLFLDLDRFKTINDTLGHAIGDCLLKEVVKRLLNCIREEDTISRWGGDEFTLLLPHINSLEDVNTIARRIFKVLQAPFQLEDYYLHITSSIGIAIYPDSGTDSETLLKNADVALYQAKDKGRNNYQHYNQTINAEAEKLLKLENGLRYALEKKEFAIYYQPIIDVSTGKIIKLEALLRWKHSTLGLISPQIFIPLAEENGSILQIGEWVLEKACLQSKYWQTLGIAPLKIAINLSPRQFQQPNLVEKVMQVIQNHALEPSLIELEITETVTIQNGDLAKKILDNFQRFGISLAMDDFGTGYSSLSHLKQFPFNTIKIDRSFIQNALNSFQDRAIVKAIISLGKDLKISVVAEGVETKETRDFLQNLKCQYMQGYYFSHPLSAKDTTQLLLEKTKNLILSSN